MSKKLLLADDSVTIQKVIGISFANEDVTLVTVDNGDDAIAKARELVPDLVLVDVVMPGKTGYEVCETIKSDPNLRHIPVLLLTGTFEAFDEDRARQVGAAGHVAKPFEAQTLVDQVNQLLAASQAAPPEEVEVPTSVVVETSEESFDFFSEEISTAEPIGSGPGDSLDIGAGLPGEDAFSFGDDAFQDLNPEPIPLSSSAAPAESTVAILPDSGPPGQSTLTTELIESDFAGPGDSLVPVEPVAATAVEAGATTALFDGDLDALSTDTVDLAQATVLDPGSASGFDVSGSDVGDSIYAPEVAPAELMEGQAPDSRGEDVSRAALDAVVPKLREQLHDTLEKVAWESFGSITEEIVRQAVDRVEAVAWEVIPQLAETLIHEEIRKMKGEE